jgi:predicted RecA/RadA family phage recombinase
MAYEEAVRSITLNADSSIAVYTGVPGLPGSASPNGGKQYYFVKVTGAHQVGLAGASDTTVIGVLQNKPQATGNAATVGIRGVSKVVAGGAITAGSKVYVNSSGQATVTAGSSILCGIALSASANAGELISVLLGFQTS